jgi:hypothetical protein
LPIASSALPEDELGGMVDQDDCLKVRQKELVSELVMVNKRSGEL